MVRRPNAHRSPAEIARLFICPDDRAGTPIPEHPTAEWINANSSYVYVGGGVSLEDLFDWGQFVLIHERFDRGHRGKLPDGSEGRFLTAGMADCHTDFADEGYVRNCVDESSRVIEAIRTGGPFPDGPQMSWDLGMIWKAIDAYTKDHAGEMPPDLGSTLAYVPTDHPRAKTAAQRASVFLSPAAKRNVRTPEAPTADWVNAHTSYVYLGGPGLWRVKIPDRDLAIVVHANPADAYAIKHTGHETRVVPFLRLNGGIQSCDPKLLAAAAAESKQALDAARLRGPMPDGDNALRDLRAMIDAVVRYAKDHDDHLPPDLGATVPYLSAETLSADTEAERARVYLSPAAEKSVPTPAKLTPEWVNQNTTYVYLGDPRLTLTMINQNSGNVLIHASLKEEFRKAWFGDTALVAAAHGMGVIWLEPRDNEIGQIEAGKARMRELITPTK